MILKTIHDIRPDVRIVANDVLLAVNDLADLFLPMNNISRSGISANIRRIDIALEREEAVVFFPCWGSIPPLNARYYRRYVANRCNAIRPAA